MEILNNGATFGEQRQKINDNFSEIDEGKLDKEIDKSLVDNDEILRLSSVTNQDLSGLATEQFVADGLADKQTILDSSNIKTVNGESVLGSGNITIASGSSLWTEDASYEAFGTLVIRKILGYYGGVGTLPTELSANIGKYNAKIGGYTSVKADATAFNGIFSEKIFNEEAQKLKFLGNLISSDLSGLVFINTLAPLGVSLYTYKATEKKKIVRLRIKAANAGIINLTYRRGTVVTVFKTATLEAGWNDVVCNFDANKDDFIGFDTSTSTAKIYYIDGDTGGNYYAPAINPGAIAIEVYEGLVLGYPIKTFKEIVTEAKPKKEIGASILNENFISNELPFNMENLGGWTFANGEALQSVNGIANSLQGMNYTNYSRTTTRAFFKLKDSASHFALFNRPVVFLQSGSIVSLDIATNKLILYSNWDGTNVLPAVKSSKVVSFTLVVGREYRLDIIHRDKDLEVYVFDMVTGATDSIITLGGTAGFPLAGYSYGKPGCFSIAGEVSLTKIQYYSNIENPKVIFYGDSITEGYQIPSVSSYAYKATALIGNALVSAQSSIRSADAVKFLREELRIFKPKYVHILIGTNDNDLTVWSNNIDTIYNMVKEAGSMPIFGIIPLNSYAPPHNTTWKANILAKNYNVVRYDLATSVGNDGVTQNTTLFNTDLTHPNALGGQAMFDRLKLDAPELFQIL